MKLQLQRFVPLNTRLCCYYSSRMTTTTTTRAKPNAPSSAPPSKKKKTGNAAPLPENISKEALDQQPLSSIQNPFVAVAWNVAGLRSMLNDKEKTEALKNAAKGADCLMLGEHKLNPENVAEVTKQLEKVMPEFKTFRFACSTAKKGYSGVCVFTRAKWKGDGSAAGATPMKQKTITEMFGGGKSKKNNELEEETAVGADDDYDGPKLINISEGLLDGKHLDEGRVLTLEYDAFYLMFSYVPNSGAGLARLDWRINTWEKECREHLNALQKKKPTVYGGDLNVAHLDIDIYNVGAKHIPKSAGTTKEERDMFGIMLEECKMKDCFRNFNEDKKGWFTYWSQRAGNRPKNWGLRLDYFLAGEKMFEKDANVRVASCGILTEQNGSDHCPVVVTLDVHPTAKS